VSLRESLLPGGNRKIMAFGRANFNTISGGLSPLPMEPSEMLLTFLGS
jgi:hypothetical protein